MNVHRGIAQLVEQRSPKPRAVSSRLTTPATNAQVLRSLCVLFLRFRIGSASLCQYQRYSYFIFALPAGLRPCRKCLFTEGVVPGSNTFYLQYLLRARSFREAAFRHLPWLGLPNSFRQLQREGSLSEGAGTTQAVTEGVSSHFFRFLKFMLDKCGIFRYNKARSGGKRRAKLERSWPGSSVG